MPCFPGRSPHLGADLRWSLECRRVEGRPPFLRGGAAESYQMERSAGFTPASAGPISYCPAKVYRIQEDPRGCGAGEEKTMDFPLLNGRPPLLRG